MGACESCFETSRSAVPPPVAAALPVQVVYTIQDQEAVPETVVYQDTLDLPTVTMANQPYTVTTVTTETTVCPGQTDQVVIEDSDDEHIPEIEEISVVSSEEDNATSSCDVEITSTAVEPSVVTTPEEVDTTSDGHEEVSEVPSSSSPVSVELIRTAAALEASQTALDQPESTVPQGLTSEGASFALAASSGIVPSPGEGSTPVPTVMQTIMTMTSGVQPQESGPVYQTADSGGDSPEAGMALEPMDAGPLAQQSLGLAEVSTQFDIGLVPQVTDVTSVDEVITTDEVFMEKPTIEDSVVLEEVVETTSSVPAGGRKFPYLYDRPQLYTRPDEKAANLGSLRKFPYLYDRPIFEYNDTVVASSSTSIARQFPYIYDHPALDAHLSLGESSESLSTRVFPYIYDHPQVGASRTEVPSAPLTSRRQFPYLYDASGEVAVIPPRAEAKADVSESKQVLVNDHEDEPVQSEAAYELQSENKVASGSSVPAGMVASAAAPMDGTHDQNGYDSVSLQPAASTSADDSSIKNKVFPYLYDEIEVPAGHADGGILLEAAAPSDRVFPYLYDESSSDQGSDTVITTVTTVTTIKTRASRTNRASKTALRE